MNELRRTRLRLKMTQEQFAAELGVTARQVNRWEHDKSVPSTLAQRAIDRLVEQRQREALSA